MKTMSIALLSCVLMSACSAPAPTTEATRAAEAPLAVSAKDAACTESACATLDAPSRGEAMRSRGGLGRSMMRAVSLF